MIAQFAKNLRKWAIELAMAVRNQVRAVVAKGESVGAAAADGADRMTGPDAAETAPSAVPPAHWVQLVERHAPELLAPGPPDTAPRESPRVFEADPADVQGDSIQGPTAANPDPDGAKSPSREGPAFPLKFSRLSRRPGAPPERRSARLPDAKRSTRAADRPAEAVPEPSRDDAGSHAPAPPPAESATVQRAAVSAAGAEKTTPGSALSRHSNAGPLDPRTPESEITKTAAPVAWTSPAPRFGSAAGRIVKNRSVKRKSQHMRPGTAENSQSTSRTTKGLEPVDRPTENRQTRLQSAGGKPAPAAIKPAGFYEKGPRPTESFKARPSFPNSGIKAAAPAVKSNDDDRRQVQAVRLINEQGPGRPPEGSEIGGQKRSRAPKFHWPDLPGENSSDDGRVPDGDAAWPDLPRAAAADSRRLQPPTRPREAASRESERLRRLDEEQRGI